MQTTRSRWITTLALLVLSLSISTVHAAKPAGKGGGGGGGGGDTESTTSSTTAVPPELYRASFEYGWPNGTFTLHGVHLFDPAAPTDTTVTIGGQAVAVVAASSYWTGLATPREDAGASTDAAIVMDLNQILDALAGAGVDVLESGNTYDVSVTTPGGNVTLSAYFPRRIVRITGACPCGDFDAAYNGLAAAQTKLPDTTQCSVAVPIPTEEYVEAGFGYQDDTDPSSPVIATRIAGSHSSGSRETLFAGSCFVRDSTDLLSTADDTYPLGPTLVSDYDHHFCAANIVALEPVACTAP